VFTEDGIAGVLPLPFDASVCVPTVSGVAVTLYLVRQ
jgi:hypothetical protein